jgi:hypothetical protein
MASHWIIASHYNRIASEMPYVVNDVRIPHRMQARHKCMYWLLLALIVPCAVLLSVLGIPYYNQVYIKKTT